MGLLDLGSVVIPEPSTIGNAHLDAQASAVVEVAGTTASGPFPQTPGVAGDVTGAILVQLAGGQSFTVDAGDYVKCSDGFFVRADHLANETVTINIVPPGTASGTVDPRQPGGPFSFTGLPVERQMKVSGIVPYDGPTIPFPSGFYPQVRQATELLPTDVRNFYIDDAEVLILTNDGEEFDLTDDNGRLIYEVDTLSGVFDPEGLCVCPYAEHPDPSCATNLPVILVREILLVDDSEDYLLDDNGDFILGQTTEA